MNILTVLAMIAMASAVMFVLIRSTSAAGSESEPDMHEPALFGRKHSNPDNVTCVSLKFYCWIANLQEINSFASDEVDASVFRGPIRLISDREEGTIQIINTMRGSVKSRPCDIDIASLFPAEADEIYRLSNRCFSHHEADIVFDSSTGTIHLQPSAEKANRKLPSNMYSYATGKRVDNLMLVDGTAAVIGDYLFVFTCKSKLPETILCDEPAPSEAEKPAAAKRTGRAAAAKKSRTSAATARKKSSPSAAGKSKAGSKKR